MELANLRFRFEFFCPSVRCSKATEFADRSKLVSCARNQAFSAKSDICEQLRAQKHASIASFDDFIDVLERAEFLGFVVQM